MKTHIVHPLTTLAVTQGDRLLTVCDKRRRTAAEVAGRVAALSTALRLECGLQTGDTVALAAQVSDHCFEAVMAVVAAGAIIAPLNTRWSLKVD